MSRAWGVKAVKFVSKAHGGSALATVQASGPCQTSGFPVFARPGVTKHGVSQWSTALGAPLLWSSHIREPWRIKSPLWALHCCGQAIFETPGASNHHSGRSTAVVKQYSKPLAHQITTLGVPLLWSSHIRDPVTSNHKLLLTSGDRVQQTGQQILQKLCV